jgi:uncharacterized protein (TIGR01244 family)
MTRALLLTTVLSAGVAAYTAPQSPPPAQSSPAAQTAQIEGVRNYTKVDATIGCAGATDAKALGNIAKLGYKAVMNLREASETGVDIDASRAAAKAAGLTYIHLPFKGSAPDPKVASEFLKLVGNTDNQPLFIHCGSANRVGAMWMIKRMLVDHWSQERALEEAKAIGLSSERLQQFALEYVATHKS